MNRQSPIFVGITGGIGAGKTTIAKLFTVLGIPVYNADNRAKWLMANDSALRNSISNAFGDESFTNEGQLNKAYLAKTVFSDSKKTALINSLVHPAVKMDFTQWAVDQHTAYVIKEAALLFETGSYRDLDKTILVSAPMDIRISRVMERDPQRDQDQIHEIIARQLPEEEKKALADFVVDNKGNKLVIPQVLKIHKALLSA
ncbi:dephospho-CoA kinase [Lunatibacter salilacus]|uniref:dephospho-CoA kinase n=1 Tax=Lunatibacter salilacus TaxID=2483804 RepID=UPI00131CC2B7|nr:dephospho-CoA kinase [Lunatibacter salilacus]